MQRKCAVITGAAGQDGSFLIELLLSKDYIVYGMVRRSSNMSNLDRLTKEHSNRHLHLVYGDMVDTVLPFQNEGMTSQIHHACGKRMVSIKDPTTNHILRSWKCCPHCEATKHDDLLESDKVGKVVHRDKNAAKNIRKIGLCLLENKHRPEELCYHRHK
jgi:hypothetical protein